MATDHSGNALAYIGANAVVENFAMNSIPKFLLTGAYTPIPGTSYIESVGFAPEGSVREMATIDDYIVGAYPKDIYNYWVEKNSFDNADTVVIAPGLTDMVKKRGAVNIYQTAGSKGWGKTREMLRSLITSDVQAMGRNLDIYTLQNLFSDLTMNLGSGSETITWEDRPGFVEGHNIDYTLATGLEEQAESIIGSLQLNKLSLTTISGITGKVIVTLPNEVAFILEAWLTKQGRFQGIVTQSPGFAGLSTKGMFMLGGDMIIMPFNKDDMNSSGATTILYECGMFYQGAISLAYTESADIYPQYQQSLEAAISDVMNQYNLSTSSLAMTSMSNVYWSDLASKINQDYMMFNPDNYSSMLGYMMFNQDATAQGSDSWQIGAKFGTGLGQGGRARKFVWDSGVAVPLGVLANSIPNYHPDTFNAKIRGQERMKKKNELDKQKKVSPEEVQMLYAKIERIEKMLDDSNKKIKFKNAD